MSSRKMHCESQLVSIVSISALKGMTIYYLPPAKLSNPDPSESGVSNIRFQQEITMVFIRSIYECIWSHSTGVPELAHPPTSILLMLKRVGCNKCMN